MSEIPISALSQTSILLKPNYVTINNNQTIKLKHKGKFAIQYSIGVKTIKSGLTWENLNQAQPVHWILLIKRCLGV